MASLFFDSLYGLTKSSVFASVPSLYSKCWLSLCAGCRLEVDITAHQVLARGVLRMTVRDPGSLSRANGA